MSRVVRWTVLLAIAAAVGCGKPAPAPQATPPPPAPVPVVAPDPTPSTIEESMAAKGRGRTDLFEAGLQRLAASADEAVRRRALALLGLFQFDQKRWAESIETLGNAVHAYPDVAPFLELRIIEAQQQLGRTGEAIASSQDLIARTPSSGAAISARIALPALFAATGDRTGAESAAAALGGVPIDELTESEMVAAADQLAHFGYADLATPVRMRVLTTYPQGRYTEKIYGQLASSAPPPLDSLTFDEATSLASRMGRHNRYDQALDLLRRIGERFPDQLDSTFYRSIRARALFNARKYRELTGDPSLDLPSPGQQILRARAFWRSDRPEQFLAGLKALQRKHPESKEAIEAKLLLAKYYTTDETDLPRAIGYLNQAIAAGAAGEEGENLWALGWAEMLRGHDEAALETLDKYIASYADGDYRTNSLFWSARILNHLDRRAESAARYAQLIREYPYSYYAYRARAILGDTSPPPSEIANGRVFPEVEREIAAADDSRVAAVRALDSLGLVRDAIRETKRMVADHPDNRGMAFLLADLYVRGGEEAKANGVLQRSFRDFVRHGGIGIPARFWEIAFPLHYWDAIRPAAESRGVDPYLVAGIIRQESAFEPTDVSNAGAVGLMQIMPEEARRIAAVAGLQPPTREMLFDPGTNIAVGVAEYFQKLASMKGNQILAVAAYNAGEDAVGRWLARTPIDDVDLFVDSIPYAETRLYVKSVTRNQAEYRRIYAQRLGSTEEDHP